MQQPLQFITINFDDISAALQSYFHQSKLQIQPTFLRLLSKKIFLYLTDIRQKKIARRVFAIGPNFCKEFGVILPPMQTKIYELTNNSEWMQNYSHSLIYRARNRFSFFDGVTNELLSAGCNVYGECGIGHRNMGKVQTFTPVMLQQNRNIRMSDMRCISQGIANFHTLFVTSDQRIYGYGASCNGVFGNGKIAMNKSAFTNKTFASIVQKLPSLQKKESSFPITFMTVDRAKMISFKNDFFPFENQGNIPLPNIYSAERMIPLEYYFNSSSLHIIKIECGSQHTLFLTKCGTVHACGKIVAHSTPEMVDVTDKIPEHMIAQYLQTSKTVESVADIKVKKKVSAYEYILDVFQIKIDEQITDIAVGEEHNLCLSANGRVFVFGDNRRGQLGISSKPSLANSFDTDVRYISYFQPLANPFFDKLLVEKSTMSGQIFCGANHSAVVVAKYDCAYFFGEHSDGQCGSKKMFSKNKCQIVRPTLLTIELEGNNVLPVQYLSLGANHSVVLSTDGDVYTFGGNAYCQCTGEIIYRGRVQKIVLDPYLLTGKEMGLGSDEVCKVVDIIAGNYTTIIMVDS